MLRKTSSGATVKNEPVFVLFFLTFFFMCVALAIVDVVANLAQPFVVAEEVFDVEVIAGFGFNFIGEDAVHCACLCANGRGFCVCVLARRKDHGHSENGSRLNVEFDVHLYELKKNLVSCASTFW